MGTYYDGNPIYVGTGNFAQCWGQNPGPSRISTVNSFRGPGAYRLVQKNHYCFYNENKTSVYSSCQGAPKGENYDTKNPRFFFNHPDLRWIKTNGASYLSVEGGILVSGVYIGRINITFQNITFQQIGKIWAGHIYYNKPDLGYEITSNGEFEILACTTCPISNPGGPCCENGGTGKYCCTNGATNSDCCANGGAGLCKLPFLLC